MTSINKLQFRNLVQTFTKRITDSSMNDTFNSLTKRGDSRNNSRNDENLNEDLNGNKSPRGRLGKVNINISDDRSSSPGPKNDDNRLELSVLQSKFESFCKTQESMSSILNVRVIKQRFMDF